MQTLFTVLITIQFLVIVAHDWLEIPGFTHGSQVQAAIGKRKLLIATLINALFPATAVALAFWFWHRPKPGFVVDYWMYYCAITLGSAIVMWYVPYLIGCDPKTRELYAQMYAGTRHVLPPNGDNPRPNLLHISFHLLFVSNLVLALILRFG